MSSVSRRELFRGLLGGESHSHKQSESVLGTTPLPAQPPPIPTLVEATLTDDEVALLFAELATHGHVLRIHGKGTARGHSAEANLALKDAKEQLLSGRVRSMQLCYRYDGAEWTDTLIRQGGATRLVRCRHDV